MRKYPWHCRLCRIYWRKLLRKTPFFVLCYILSKSTSSEKIQFKSPALVDLQSMSPSSPKRYIYNYRENCHDKIIASVTLHVTKLHVTGFMRVSAVFLTSWNQPESKWNDATNRLKKWQSCLIPCNPIVIPAFPFSLYNFHFIWKQCSRITYFCRLAVSFRYFKSR